MSGSFTFPPPPPPPPKPAAPANGFARGQYDSQISRERGRGRWRGNPNGRRGGRGNQSTRDHERPSPGQYAGYQHAQNGTDPGMRAPHSQQANAQQPWMTGLCSGTHVNPHFAHQQQVQQHGHWPPQNQRSGFNASPALFNSPPRTYAGHKRKLEVLRPPSHDRKPALQTAPSVPSFAAPILPLMPQTAQASRAVKAKPPSNLFGIMPGDGDRTSTSSESEGEGQEVDEEAMYAGIGTKLTFEHNGEVVSLSSAADIIAWQNERKRRWPTSVRMAEKEADRRRVGQERKRLLAGAAKLNDTSKARDRQSQPNGKTRRFSQMNEEEASVPGAANPTAAPVAKPVAEIETNSQRARRELAEREGRLQALRKRVADSEASFVTARSHQAAKEAAEAAAARESALLLDYEDADEDDAYGSEASPSILSESSVVSSDTSDMAESVDEDNDGDALPEEITTKQPAVVDTSNRSPVCRYFAACGHCRDGDACRFRHELSVAAQHRQQHGPSREVRPPRQQETDSTSERKGIYQRLLEQQQEEEDRLALQAIKYLGKTGFFRDEPKPSKV